MKLEEWLEGKRQEELDRLGAEGKPTSLANILAPEMEPGEAAGILADEILGPYWFIPYSCNGKQALTEAVAAVVAEFRRRKRKRFRWRFWK